MDDLIDVIEGNRKYMKCIYVYNKIDVIGIDDVDKLARQPNSVVISCNLKACSAPHIYAPLEFNDMEKTYDQQFSFLLFWPVNNIGFISLMHSSSIFTCYVLSCIALLASTVMRHQL